MSKSAKRRLSAKLAASAKTAKPSAQRSSDSKEEKGNSKQSRVIAMLQSSSGATITAMMKATGWQKHSVRGFLAGVVRKRLKLKLESTKVGDDRIYRIAGKSYNKPSAEGAKRQAA
jgi:flagellar biosynthesis protein FlhB